MNPIIEQDIKAIVKRNINWNLFSRRTVLISGASGFIATYLVETLMYLNAYKNFSIRVLAVVRNKNKAVSKFSRHLKSKQLSLIIQDICEPLKIREKIDYITHAESHASPKFYSSDPVGTLKPNITGTMNLLELARNKKVKGFLFMSSGEIYGSVVNAKKEISETDYGFVDPMSLRSCYAESKRMGEAICVSWYHQYGVPIKIVRLFHTYGPGMSLDDGRVHADFVANVVRGQDIVMKSEGKSLRTFCYIADTVSAILTVLLKGRNGEVYNVGNNQAEIQIRELASLLSGIISNKEIKVIKEMRKSGEKYIESPIERCRPNIEKIKQLDWKPMYGLKDGFERTILSYLTNIAGKA